MRILSFLSLVSVLIFIRVLVSVLVLVLVLGKNQFFEASDRAV